MIIRVNRARTREGSRNLIRGALLVVIMALLPLTAAACSERVSIAEARLMEGELVPAEMLFRETLASDPENVRALGGLALALTLQGRYDEALIQQERVIAADPADGQTRVELGFNYLNHQGRPEDAVRVLQEAVGLDPSAKNLTFLAQAQVAQGDKEGAERSLRRATETDPAYAYSYGRLVDLLGAEGREEAAREVAEQAALYGIALAVD
jgi:tetratricopeptide (TPR) repeat protein